MFVANSALMRGSFHDSRYSKAFCVLKHAIFKLIVYLSTLICKVGVSDVHLERHKL